MVRTAKKYLIKLLVDHGLLKFGEFTLKSGATSTYYVDLRELSMKPKVYNFVCDELVSYISENLISKDQTSRDRLGLVGVPYGVVPLAAVVAKAIGIIYYPVRKEVKNYGLKPDENLCSDFKFIIIEDVMSTGSSIIETMEKMPGKDITDVVVVVNRELGGEENIKKYNSRLRLHFLLKSSEILDYYQEMNS